MPITTDYWTTATGLAPDVGVLAGLTPSVPQGADAAKPRVGPTFEDGSTGWESRCFTEDPSTVVACQSPEMWLCSNWSSSDRNFVLERSGQGFGQE
jgi:hypothetical protein